MRRKVSFQAVLAAASVAASAVFAPVCAQDPAPPADMADIAADDALPKPRQVVEKPFTALVRCVRVQGTVQVLKPGASEWTDAEEERYYPMGSSFRTVQGEVSAMGELEFGPQATVKLTGSAEVSTRPIEIGEAARTVELKSGRVLVNLPRALKEGLFFVAAPFFTCSNLAGESQFDYQSIGNGDEVVVRCVTGTMTLEGRHYKFPRMAAANQVRIRTTDGDDLISWLRGESGDSKVTLDQGMIAEKNFETGESKDVPKTYDFSLSPRCAVKIFRRRSKVGGNMIVSSMAFDASGEIKTRCAFAEGRSNVNSGELVIAPAEAADAEKKKAKAASEETEEVEAVETKPAKAKEPANADGDAAEEKKDDKEEKKNDKNDDDI